MTEPGHNSRANTIRESARFILACDQEVADVNERKKEFFADLRGQLPDEDIKALKDAIKLHRKRLKDKDGTEAHDARVWSVLSIIEGSEVPRTEETAPRAEKTALAGIVEETAPSRAHARIARDAEPHDPETGELTETPEGVASTGAGAVTPQGAPQGVPAPVSAPVIMEQFGGISGTSFEGAGLDIPPFMKRTAA